MADRAGTTKDDQGSGGSGRPARTRGSQAGRRAAPRGAARTAACLPTRPPLVPRHGYGSTSLDNLLLVCARHHTLLHTQGFQLTLHPDRTLTVLTADGTEVPHHPELPWGDADELDLDRHLQPTTLTPDSVEPRLDLHYIVSVLSQQAA